MRLAGSAFAALALVVLLIDQPAAAYSMREEIEHLLGFIAASPCTFIRNGAAYDGATAVAHIRDKYDYYRSDIHRAEDFIALAASRSAMTGRPYLVQCGVNPMPAADWLAEELAIFRRQQP